MVAFLFIFAGCSTVKVYQSNPHTQLASNDYFDVEFEPQLAKDYHYFNSFRFVLTNKTDKDLILDWSRTYYLRGGKKFGQWGWEEMTFEDLKEAKAQPLITIEAGDMLTNVIFPIKLVGWKKQQEQITGPKTEDRFVLGVIPEGQNGIELYIKHNGKIITQRVTLTITSVEYTKQLL
jgi:hypothetical protein